MNFEELRSQWDNEGSGDVHIPDNIQRLNEARHPVEKLKKNMKKEFINQVAAILLVAFFPLLFKMQSSLLPVYYIGYLLFVLISVYFLYHFYLFYNQVQFYDGGTKDNLLNLYYNLRLNMERYKSFSFLIMPFSYFFGGLLIYSPVIKKGSMGFFDDGYLILSVIAVITIFMVAITIWWINHFYGRYVKQLKQILNTLKEE